MSREAIVRTYLAAMAAGDLTGITSCFVPDGRVSSPVYGGVPVAAFYRRLFADTLSASVDIRTIFASEDGKRIAVHFGYHWELVNGTCTVCDVVDIFDFEAGTNLITHLQVLFDTAQIGKANAG
jgi:hypothetical protein